MGYDAIEEKWKTNLELIDVIIEMADDLCHGCQMSEFGHYEDVGWTRKYIYMQVGRMKNLILKNRQSLKKNAKKW
ncbi:MAG: hypothetical protein ACLR1V_12055 [Coprococcus sp.]